MISLFHIGAKIHYNAGHKYNTCIHVMHKIMTLQFCMEIKGGILNYSFFLNPCSSDAISLNHNK